MKRTEIHICTDYTEPGIGICNILDGIKLSTTGRYKEVNGVLYVEVKEKGWIFSDKMWVAEFDFTFVDIEEFTCGEQP